MRRVLFIMALPLLFLATGCATRVYRAEMQVLLPAYAVGDFDAALGVTTPHVEAQP
ncbi:MAG: hypothetical protein FWF96_03580 [Kiritimatiellaeota bacterium]|nr:hypothetical protein [Kiritimatiellota bacterium]